MSFALDIVEVKLDISQRLHKLLFQLIYKTGKNIRTSLCYSPLKQTKMLSSFFGIVLLAASGQILFAAGCTVESNRSGVLDSSGSGRTFGSGYGCWKMAVPDGQYVDLIVTSWSTYDASMTGKVETSKDTITLGYGYLEKHIIVFDDVKISISASETKNYPSYAFKMTYEITDINCRKNGSVICGDGSCVHKDKVCDGVKDCSDGKDEKNCKFGREVVAGINDSLSEGVSWLKGQMQEASETWRRDTPRAITALYLADGVTFDGTCDEDEALVRELEVKTAVAVMRNASYPVLPVDLALLIHGLLVTCYDPRHFYGFDLVQILDDQLAVSPNDTAQPLASLALCNAGQPPTKTQVERLQHMLDSKSAQPFLLDVQAVALMALSCIRKKDGFEYVSSIIDTTAARFEQLQRPDGSFGNIYTTAFVAQALMAAKGSAKWKVSFTLKYLMKQQANDSSFGDFLATYLILPILNDRTLADIGKVRCSDNKRRPKEEDMVPDVDKKPDPKMEVRYSLYVGEQPDVVPTVTLRVPPNRTAYQIMQTAAEANPKFQFECHVTSDKMYVFSIDGVANDPEYDKFWLFYLERKNDGNLELITEAPDKRIIKDGEHIVMWYQKTTVV